MPRVTSYSFDATDELSAGLLRSDSDDSSSEGVESTEHPSHVGRFSTPHPFTMTPFTRSPVKFFNERFQAGSIKGSVFTLMVALIGAGTLR